MAAMRMKDVNHFRVIALTNILYARLPGKLKVERPQSQKEQTGAVFASSH